MESAVTSPAAASDHLLWPPVSGNNGKWSGDLEPLEANGNFMVCSWPGLGKGPLGAQKITGWNGLDIQCT